MLKIYQDLLLNNGLKFTIKQEEATISAKKLELKNQFHEQIYAILLTHILLRKELLLLQNQMKQK